MFLYVIMKRTAVVILSLCFCGISALVEDVLDNDVVETLPSVALSIGESGTVPCTVKRVPNAVYWRKTSPSSRDSTLVIVDMSHNVGSRSGPGYDDGLYDMTDDFSLVIMNVSISNQDVYFCEVSDRATGTVFRDHTNVTVFALPSGPYPCIAQCERTRCASSGEQECSIASTSPTNLTCYVHRYYPNIALYFILNSEKIDSQYSRIWHNVDGTMGKSVTILANASSYSYHCIAVRIDAIGNVTEQSAFIRIKNSYPPPETNYKSLQIGMIFLSGIIGIGFPVVFMAVCCCLSKKSKNDNESVKTAPETSRSTQSYRAPEIRKEVIQDKPNPEELETGYIDIVNRITERHLRRLITALSPENDLPSVEELVEQNNEFLFNTHRMIEDWKNDGGLDNREAERYLRTAAERIGRQDLIAEGSDREYNGFCNDELKQIVKYVTPAAAAKLWETLGIEGNIPTGNNLYEQLQEWLQHTSSTMTLTEQREKLLRGLDPYLSVEFLTDEEIELLDKHAPCRFHGKKLLEATQTEYSQKHGDGNKDHPASTVPLIQDLKKWRDNLTNKTKFKSTRSILQGYVGKLDKPGLLPRSRGKLVYKAELVDLAFHIAMQDVLGLAHELCINEARMVSYRSKFDQSHLKQGTFSLVIKLYKEETAKKDNKREVFCSKLISMGYIDVARYLAFGFNISLGEMYLIIQKIEDQRAAPISDNVKSVKGSSTSIRPEDLAYIHNVLGLTSDEIRLWMGTRHTDDILPLLKAFKARIRQVPFNYRAELVRNAADVDKLNRAHDIFSGTFLTRYLNKNFVQDIVNGMKEQNIQQLLMALDVFSESASQSGKDSQCEQICDAIEGMLEKVYGKGSVLKKILSSRETKLRQLRDRNDALVDSGFFELAWEVMLIGTE